MTRSSNCRRSRGNTTLSGPKKIEELRQIGVSIDEKIKPQDPYAVTFYKLGDTYYGARSNEFGYANYEIIPPPPIAVNPLTEVTDQFSIELGLTEQQKEQIVPILKDEIKRLEALKKDTSLSGLQKLEQAAGHRRLHRREDQAAAQRGATAEVPGNARSAAAADAREDGGRGRCQIGRYGRAALGEDEAGLGDVKTEVGGGLVGLGAP